jgi:hypothetical protein
VSYIEVLDCEHDQRWCIREPRNRKAYELIGLFGWERGAGMRSTLCYLSILISLFFFIGCSFDDAQFEAFGVTIFNNSSSVITNLDLTMIGSNDNVEITSLEAGQKTNVKTFVLQIVDGEKPDSWGDYIGEYKQRDEIKDITIQNYDHNFRKNVWIEIDSMDYTVLYPK